MVCEYTPFLFTRLLFLFIHQIQPWILRVGLRILLVGLRILQVGLRVLLVGLRIRQVRLPHHKLLHLRRRAPSSPPRPLRIAPGPLQLTVLHLPRASLSLRKAQRGHPEERAEVAEQVQAVVTISPLLPTAHPHLPPPMVHCYLKIMAAFHQSTLLRQTEAKAYLLPYCRSR